MTWMSLNECHVHWSYMFYVASIEFSASEWMSIYIITTTNDLSQHTVCKANFTAS